MVTRIQTVAFQGLTVVAVDVQVHLSQGIPGFTIVGLPDKAVAESRERIRAALLSIGLALPPQRITVNLSPADLLKEGSHYDVPVALGVLAAMGVIPLEELSHYIALGELALDSTLVGVTGVLATALYCLEKEMGLICPQMCGAEAGWAKGVEVIAAPNLISLIQHLKGDQALPTIHPQMQDLPPPVADLSEVRGQEAAKRALLVTAAGGHNLLMEGPPGAGKSMLALRMMGLLPPLLPEEALQVSLIHSFAGLLSDGKLIRQRPFRAPHHSCSQAALVGGGPRAKPGEISLAHNGVLFLDELPEFPRQALEALRQPVEDGQIIVARVHSHVVFPARFQLIAAMNPCRCGYMRDARRQCSRVPVCGRENKAKLSGPLLDRIDLCVQVPALSVEALARPPETLSTQTYPQHIEKIRARQMARQGCLNAHLPQKQVDGVAHLDSAGLQTLHRAAESWGLSARGYYRVLKVARTIADLEEREAIDVIHVNEALAYRQESS